VVSWPTGNLQTRQVGLLDPSMRSKLIATGIFFGFLCNLLIVIYVESSAQSWRILTNTTLIPTMPLLVMIYLMPESPRYLMKHGRYEKALDAFNQIQTTPLLAARDLMYAHAQLDFESRILKGNENEFGNLADRIDLSISCVPRASHGSVQRRESRNQPNESDFELDDVGQLPSDTLSLDIEIDVEMARKKRNPYSYHIGVTGYYKRLTQLWSNMRCRRALLAASVAMISQQMTGVNTIAFLGTIVCKSRRSWGVLGY
jgi:hypothetical protein